MQCDAELHPAAWPEEKLQKVWESLFLEKKGKCSILNMSALSLMLNESCLSVLPFSGAEILPEASVQGMVAAMVAAEQESSQWSGC